MGAIHRKRRRTWVDGEEYGTEREAARAAGVSISTVHDALKAGGRTVKGHRISPEAPRKEEKRAAPVSRSRGEPLLRYPPGEGPLYQGSKRWT
jgi:hypothetical protein